MFKLSFLSLLLVTSFASAEEARRANAHVHGLNNLSMVISQNQVAISYEMPIVQLLDEHDEHEGHGEFDVHVWLDPENAKVLVNEIKQSLIELDPSNAAQYQLNSDELMVRLDQLIDDISVKLAPEKEKGFVVFHDAYQYFEERFGLSAVGSITVSPEVMPGASRIKELKDKINELNALCVFSEPQFEPKLVSTVIEGTNASTGVLDPLGASIKDGPELYFTLINNMANSLKECLSKKG